MNSRPGSTWRTFGHPSGQRLLIAWKALATLVESFEGRGSVALSLLAKLTLVYENLKTFFPPRKSLMGKEKKISLMNCIWRFNIKIWSRNMPWGRQINLLDGLLHQPKFCVIFRHSSFFSQLLYWNFFTATFTLSLFNVSLRAWPRLLSE